MGAWRGLGGGDSVVVVVGGKGFEGWGGGSFARGWGGQYFPTSPRARPDASCVSPNSSRMRRSWLGVGMGLNDRGSLPAGGNKGSQR